MTFDKRTFEKPIPISPTIALDRERCILCYRCTRFSEDVAEDGQLIARDRGALSQIATYEDLPYRAPFSGNVIELCPVGALTSTLYRFEARPWEIVNVPTVCGLCPVGCNVSATYREGHVRRVSSRNHPEIDRGWICDKGRFSVSGAACSGPRDGARDPRSGARGGSRRRAGTTRSTSSSGWRGRPATRSCSHSPARRRWRSPRRSRSSCARASARIASCCPRRRARRSIPSARRCRRSRTRSSSSSSETTPWRSARRSSTSGSARRGGTAPRC